VPQLAIDGTPEAIFTYLNGALDCHHRACHGGAEPDQCASLYPSRSVTLLDAIPALMRDVTDGKIGTYWSVLNHR
jgi:hypothetical protein